MKKKIWLLILFVLVLFFLTLLMPDTFVAKKKINKSYNNVLKDSITNMDAKITDIALLGAHDAFSSKINMKSKPNVVENKLFGNKIVNSIGKGLVVRLSKSQTVGAYELFYAGVRYFDIRITMYDKEYYTTHGYLSDKLENYLKDLVECFAKVNGEYVVLDFQHYYLDDKSNYSIDISEYNKLLDFIGGIKNTLGYSLLDYVRYDTTIDPLSSLTYGKVTNNGASNGVIIISKVNGSNLIYSSNDNIRSNWHETNSKDVLLEGIKSENDSLKENPTNKLVVNQAQLTGFIADKTLVRSLFNWSLINQAKSSNKLMINDKEAFMDWLEQMPIFMVDNATSNKGKFNKTANEYIIEFNKKL